MIDKKMGWRQIVDEVAARHAAPKRPEAEEEEVTFSLGASMVGSAMHDAAHEAIDAMYEQQERERLAESLRVAKDKTSE
ncbi:hypothetical protein [Kosakonia sacchari]|uniref:hypothetical protein n=1 Tax=Kosakonia sacchari TaxID=1158459 RepID=UPI001584F492|nr:hypothetical protein [Kosakonia sacchari]NUL35076.1 hypothetical protein [Kosakonia sacchari]